MLLTNVVPFKASFSIKLMQNHPGLAHIYHEVPIRRFLVLLFVIIYSEESTCMPLCNLSSGTCQFLDIIV